MRAACGEGQGRGDELWWADDEEIECAPSKRKFLHWTPLEFLNSLGHTTGFSTSKGL